MINILIGLYVGISIGSMQLYYMMTKDFSGALLLALVWPYVIYIHIRDDFATRKGM